jgi:hypothetical protein
MRGGCLALESAYAKAPARQPSSVAFQTKCFWSILIGLPSRSPRRGRRLVEAAGVEPASEIIVSQENPCSVQFRMVSPLTLRTDKMRQKLVR